MKFGKIESKNVLGIFDKGNHREFVNNDVIEFAADYWASAIANAKKNQISFQIGNGIINVTEEELERFRKAFSDYIVNFLPNNDGIMLWTSNGEYFDRIGTDGYLKEIMKNCKLPLTCLPSEMCMLIYSNIVAIDDGYNYKTIYSTDKVK